MKVHKNRFLELLNRECGGLHLFCKEFGYDKTRLAARLHSGGAFTYEESKQLITAFGAAAMLSVIDWEGMNVRCPV